MQILPRLHIPSTQALQDIVSKSSMLPEPRGMCGEYSKARKRYCWGIRRGTDRKLAALLLALHFEALPAEQYGSLRGTTQSRCYQALLAEHQAYVYNQPPELVPGAQAGQSGQYWGEGSLTRNRALGLRRSRCWR